MTTYRGEGSDGPGASFDQHPFSVSRRGFDQEEVRAFLRKVGEEVRAVEQRADEIRVANEHMEAELAELREQVAASAAEAETGAQPLDEATIVAAVGEEMAGLLRSAQNAAQDLRNKAAGEAEQLLDSARSRAYLQESQAQRTLAEATAEAERLRTESQTEADDLLSGARSLSERLRSEAEAEAERLRSEAEAEAERLRSEAEAEAERLRSESQAEADHLLSDARFESERLRSDAKTESDRLLFEARTESERLRSEAKAESDRVRAEATGQAQREAEELLTKAKGEAAAIAADAERDRRLTVDGAQVARERILSDLARRRRIATVQIEQLRAGRERLLVSYGVVRRTLEEVHEEFQRADSEARAAAEEAGRRMAEQLGADDSLDADLDIDTGEPGVGTGDSAVDAGVGVGESVVGTDVAEAGEQPAVGEDSGSDAVEPVVGGDREPGASVTAVETTVGDPPGGDAPESPVSLASEALTSPPIGGAATFFGGPPAPPEPSGPGGLPSDPMDSLGAPAGASEPTAQPPLRFFAGAATSPATAGGAATIVAAEVSADLVVISEPEPAPGAEAVAGLFERIRSGQESSVAEARRLLDTPGPAGAGLIPLLEAAAQQEEDAGEEDEQASSLDDRSDEALLARRAAALEDTERDLSRRLKRALQDEQNDLFDRLRTAIRPYGAATLLLDAEEHRRRYAAVARSFLEQAARRGAEMAASLLPGVTETPVDVTAVTEMLATEIVVPLRRRLGAVIDEQREEDYEDIAEAVGSAYRETKTRRIEEVASDQIAACFALGLWNALPTGTPIRWVAGKSAARPGALTAAAVPCGDCDDNTLAGSVKRGEAFPTGQLHPPAHDGCHCLVVPDVAG